MTRKRKAVEVAEKTVSVPSSLIEATEEARKVKVQKMKNQQKALDSLDDHVMEALDGLYDLMRDPDKYIRLRAIEVILKKVIPEKKIKEMVGPDGGPIQVNQNVDIRTLVINAAVELDDISVEELIEASRNGRIKTIEIDS